MLNRCHTYINTVLGMCWITWMFCCNHPPVLLSVYIFVCLFILWVVFPVYSTMRNFSYYCFFVPHTIYLFVNWFINLLCGFRCVFYYANLFLLLHEYPEVCLFLILNTLVRLCVLGCVCVCVRGGGRWAVC